MIINDNIKKHLPIQNLEKIYIVTDFDRTITGATSQTSWSMLSTTNLVPSQYIKDRQKLYDYYRPIEINENLDLKFRTKAMSDWYKKHIELFIKYKISEDVFKQSVTNNIMQFRKGAKDFLSFLNNNNIPLIIISAGIGNLIESFLNKHECYYNNTYISSNKIIFKNNIAIGVNKNIIHTLNKNETSLPKSITKKIENKDTVILLGDLISDLNMVDKNTNKQIISIGFFSSRTGSSLNEFKNAFDIVCTDDDDYHKLMKTLFKS